MQFAHKQESMNFSVNESFDGSVSISTLGVADQSISHTPRGTDHKLSFTLDETENPVKHSQPQNAIRKFNNGHFSEFAIVS